MIVYGFKKGEKFRTFNGNYSRNINFETAIYPKKSEAKVALGDDDDPRAKIVAIEVTFTELEQEVISR